MTNEFNCGNCTCWQRPRKKGQIGCCWSQDRTDNLPKIADGTFADQSCEAHINGSPNAQPPAEYIIGLENRIVTVIDEIDRLKEILKEYKDKAFIRKFPGDEKLWKDIENALSNTSQTGPDTE